MITFIIIIYLNAQVASVKAESISKDVHPQSLDLYGSSKSDINSKYKILVNLNEILSVVPSELKLSNAYLYTNSSPTADVTSTYPAILVEQSLVASPPELHASSAEQFAYINIYAYCIV